MSDHLDQLAQQAAAESGFEFDSKIYAGDYYSHGQTRAVYQGGFKGKDAVLKVYDDPRPGFEPRWAENFNKINTSKILRGPEIFASKIISAHSGWYVMERLRDGSFFKMPLQPEQRQAFADLFYEYRKNFPVEAPEPGSLIESLQPEIFHLTRLSRFFILANDQEEQRKFQQKPVLLDPKRFTPAYQKGLELIRSEISKDKMVWCHGHFKPAEVYQLPGRGYVLTDFAHNHYYPSSYEPAFIVWADWLMSADFELPYLEWKKGIVDWINIFSKTFNSKLLNVALVERVFGTMLADITASQADPYIQNKRLELLYQLLEDLYLLKK